MWGYQARDPFGQGESYRVIQGSRIRILKKGGLRAGDYALYWMQASQRTECNHALEHAIELANEQARPLVVFFGIADDYPEANERHYAFMLEGLAEVRRDLEKRNIRFVPRHVSPEIGVADMTKRATVVVVDRGYTAIQRKWRKAAAESLDCALVQVESDAVVPVEEASHKEEYSAATLRRKIRPMLDDYLVPLERRVPKMGSLDMEFESFGVDDVDEALARLNIDRSVRRPEKGMHGGTSRARGLLADFIRDHLDRYDQVRNDPVANATSHMSPYLHFGQISPLYIALEVRRSGSPGADAYLEELIVRRELGMNFVFYNRAHGSYDGIPEWCRKTLSDHSKDRREFTYSLEEFESALTHDPYWNAAQLEMVRTGKMHGYMRMYWGKKILEWTKSPEEAFRIALYLNNKYELDGRDPNGFAGVAWCFGKHDRPWAERPIFGNVRYMNDRGLRRKFDADGYVRKIGRLQ